MKQDEQDAAKNIMQIALAHSTETLGLPIGLIVIPFIILTDSIMESNYSIDVKASLSSALSMIGAVTIPKEKLDIFLIEIEYIRKLFQNPVDVIAEAESVILKARSN